MEPYQVTMLGLVLDIIGAFFVAVEAIKLENLRTLRERVFRNAYRYTLSPRIRIVDDERAPGPVEDDEIPSDRYAGLFMGLHYVAGLGVLLFANHLLDGRLLAWLAQAAVWLWTRPLYIGLPLLLLALLLSAIVGLWSLGELVHMLMTGATKSAVRFLEFVEARTPDGTVGVIGFFLLVAGFGFQFYGTYLGGHR